MYKYYDIGLNLFTPSFPNPKQIIKDAENANICCILTGAQPDDNERVNTFVQSQNVYGTAGIHPHVASQATTADILRIEEIVAEVEAGAIYKGKVTRLADFGAFVAIVGNKEGLVHISQIAEERVEKVSDYLQVGQEVNVKVVEIDRQGRIRLTMKDLAPKQETKINQEDSVEEQE